jgi:hypothetical protein
MSKAKIVNIIHNIAKEKLMRHANVDEHNAELLAANIANQSLEQIVFELQQDALNGNKDENANDDPDTVFQDHAGKKVISPVFRRAPG